MDKLIIAALLSLLVALMPVEGVVNITGTGCTPTGEQGDCVSPDSTCIDINGTATCTCNTGFEPTAANDDCKKSAGQPCAADSECITGTACTTVSGTKKCTTLITGSCSGTDQSTCPDFATCTASVCLCNLEFLPNLVKSKCAKIAGQNCTADAECMTGTACTTVSGTKKCTTLIDSVCIGTDQSTCPADATCNLLQCKCNSGLTTNTAKSMCGKGTGMNCTADAECITDAACTTVSGTKKCTTRIDSVCIGTGQSTCPADATCTSLQCKCNSGYTANTAKSMCAQNGAVGVTVSLVLMAAAFVTSRFF